MTWWLRRFRRYFFKLIKRMPKPIRYFFIRRSISLTYAVPKNLTIKLAETPEEFEAAFKVLHDCYTEAGLTQNSHYHLRLSKYNGLPTTAVVIALWNNEVIGTVSHILDSALGLPMEELWDLSEYREKGELLAEVSSFAIKRGFRRKNNLLFFITRYLLDYAMKNLKVDRWVIATHPRTKDFYGGLLCFEEMDGLIKAYESVDGALAYGQSLDLNQLEENFRQVYGKLPLEKNIHFFYFRARFKESFAPLQQRLPKSYSTVWRNDDRDYFFNTHSNIEEELSERDRLILNNWYPGRSKNAMTKKTQMRFPIASFGQLLGNESQELVRVRINNISKDGLGVTTTSQLRPGEVASLKIQLGPHVIKMKAEVCWSGESKKYGLRILNTDRQLWDACLNEFEEDFLEVAKAVRQSG